MYERGAGGGGCLIGCGIAAALMLLVPMLLFGSHNNGSLDKGGQTAGATACGNAIDFVKNAEYLPWVGNASAIYLKGDQAVLIALIQTESSWNPKASAKGSSAAGLAQFVTGTASGYPEFVGGNDKHGTTWDGGKVYPNPDEHPDDARFDPERSIYAAAHKFGADMKKYKDDPEQAYIEGYHTHKNDAQLKEAQAGAKRMMDAYNKLKSGGNCSGGTQLASNEPFVCEGRKFVFPISTGHKTPLPTTHHDYSANDIFVLDGKNKIYGDPVVSITDGSVAAVHKDNSGDGGVTVRIVDSTDVSYYYAHLQAGSNEHLRKGQSVKAGEVIGKVGDTGNAKGTGPHLHLGIAKREGPQHKGWFPSQLLDPRPGVQGTSPQSSYKALTSWKKGECTDPRV
ncbi:MAG: M23 family metallopeptidase [Candidatus Berkelbacteria bacterium]|nr:MAG: M23 family metallopeptidase [Candidatus Berkelbacteria bacterium]QQG51725.1 MAG: M23 family metallopeptidase [Candidatus Berkelbacteria bacterium]